MIQTIFLILLLAATKPVVPRATGEGSIGTLAKHWGSAFLDTLHVWNFFGTVKNADSLDHQYGSYYLDWNNFINKPSTFPPSAHNQDWTTIDNKPSVYPPDAHNQNISTINNLLDSLAIKLPLHGSADSLGHYAPARFTDTTRYKADSVADNNRFVNDSTNAFELKARKGAANGYAGLGANYVPTAQLGSGSAAATNFLRGDQSWAVPDSAVKAGTAYSAKSADSLAHKSPANYPDTTRFKACSTGVAIKASGHANFTGTCLRDTIKITGITTSSIIVVCGNGSAPWAITDSVKVDTLFTWCLAADTAKARKAGYYYIWSK